MSVRPVLAVNMRRWNFAMHSLLATNEMDDLICVTEPWFSHIGVTRADDEQDGQDVLSRAAHPNWDIHYCYVTVETLSRLGIVSPIGNVALRALVLGSK